MTPRAPILAALTLLLLSGCAGTVRSPADAPPSSDELPMIGVAGPPAGGAASRSTFLMLTPATRLSDGGAPIYVPTGTYTRLSIVSRNASTGAPDAGLEAYSYRTRSPVSRFFIGRHHAISLAASVSAGAFVATVPLLAIQHESTRAGGESFGRVIRQEALQFPLLLVRANGAGDVASVTFELKGTDRSDAPAAAGALSAVIAATRLVAPAAPLLTTLSQERTRDLATAIDTTIARLFAQQITEQHAFDRPIRRWTPLVIDLYLPRQEGGWSRLASGRPPRSEQAVRLGELDYGHVGRWTVAFERPRISAFAAVKVECPNAAASDRDCAAPLAQAAAEAATEVRAHPGDVLAFPLTTISGSTGTLLSYLRQLDWWAPRLKELGSPGADPAPFCRAIRGALTDVGLNELDARLAAEAIARSAQLTPAEGASLLASAECRYAAQAGS